MTSNSGNVSVGSDSGPHRPGSPQSNEPAHPDLDSKTLGEASPKPIGSDASHFGEEGTNKTVPHPKPDNLPSDELGNRPHVPKTPYTRG